jgi:diguanylate cyclase (GGDEF)-like protein
MSELASRWLPRVTTLKRGEARALAFAFALVVTIIVITAGNAIIGIGGRAAQAPIRNWLASVVYILVAATVALRALRATEHRVALTLFAAGLTLYGLGNVLWSFWIGTLPNPPIPSVCDVLWLALYPLSYAGILGFAGIRNRRRLPAGMWLDGVIAGAGIAAIGAALVFGRVLASATGNAASVATELAYPIGDLLLAALVVGVLALRGWRLDRTWALLGGGFLCLAVADCMYAVQVAGGSSNPSPVTNLAYVVAVMLLGFAVWQPERVVASSAITSRSALVVPAAFTASSLLLLLYDHFHRLDELSFGFAVVTLIAAAIRTALTFRDVRGLAEARHQAATDDLTSLPNRRLFMLRASALIGGARAIDYGLSVLMLDLDNFKELNDTLGHPAGDALLRQIGPRLQRAVRSTDTVARLGGDEFAILLDPEPTVGGAVQVAERVLAEFGEPFALVGLALRVTATIGIASFPAHAADAESLVKHADIAMSQAKAARTGYAIYERERDTNSLERLALASELAVSLEGDGIEVHFQPIVETESRRIAGVEALVRWRRDDGRLVPPLEFLRAAEHAGLSRTLTRRVLSISLDQLHRWRDAGHELRLSVNTTVSDLLDEQFPVEVAAELAARGLPADALMLEVTETSILSDPKRIGDVVGHLRKLGVGLALDDFGTGYSSLVHLKSLAVGEVKVDQSFVGRMSSDETDSAIVHATIQLAHALGMRAVAEGVEDEATWELLRAAGCELIQGYAFSRPVPAAELTALLDARSEASHVVSVAA